MRQLNIVAYCRVSTEKEDQLNSLEAQKAFFEEFAVKNSHNLLHIYADEGISGTKLKKRKEFLKLLEDSEKGLFDMVVVKDISRFARNTVDLLTSTRHLKALGIETMFLTSNQTVLGNSEFVLTIFGALAQEESANISKRVKFGKRITAEKGRVPNYVFGYDKPVGDSYNLLIDQKEAEIVRKIYRWYTEEGYGCTKISMMLNAEGIKTKRGCHFSQNAVARILTNPIYTGKVINCKQEVTDFLTGQRRKNDESNWFIKENPNLQIVDDTLFFQAQMALKERSEKSHVCRQRQSNKYQFSTLIKCGCCGYSFRRFQRNPQNSYIRWICSGRNSKGSQSCPNTTKIEEKFLLTTIKTYLISYLSKSSSSIRLIKTAFQRIYRPEETLQEKKQTAVLSLSKLSRSKKKYLDLYENDIISIEELKDKLKQIREETLAAEKSLQALEPSQKVSALVITESSFFHSLDQIVCMEYATNALIKKLVEKIQIDQSGKIDIFIQDLHI